MELTNYRFSVVKNDSEGKNTKLERTKVNKIFFSKSLGYALSVLCQ